MSRRRSPHRDRAAIALGAAIVFLVMIFETAMAHRVKPNPASVYVWTALGLGAAASLAAAWWFRRKAAADTR